jgi:hypothetical protein
MNIRTLSLSAALVALAAAPAVQADTMLSGHAGKVFSGDDLDDSVTTYGGALTFMGDGAFGFEIEGAYTSDFYGFDELGFENNLATLMANILLGTRFAEDRGRLFLSVGGGLMKSRFDASDSDDVFDVDRNDFGVSAGLGAMGFFTDNLGIRGDVRYFRNIGDPEPDNEFDLDFGSTDFWRGTGGIVLKF